MTQKPLPDFLIIGAMKSGTTTLHAQLAAQPGLFMSTPKEPNFFSDDPIYAQGLDWYKSLFSAAPAGSLKGEASTHYTKLPTYPETVARLAAVLKTPRLVYVIRNPVERALSHYLHAWSEGEVDRDVARAFQEIPEFQAYSRYPMQLAPYLERFGREAVLLTSLEALKTNPQGEFVRIGAHIGAGDLVWDDGLEAQNVSSNRIRQLPLHGLLVDNPVAETLRRALIPQSLRDWVKSKRTRSDRPYLPDAVRTELEQTFAPDQAELAALFPEFAHLTRTYPFVSGQQ